MRRLNSTVLILTSFAFASLGFADCKTERKAMHANRKAVRDCNKAWVESLRGDEKDPAEDCVQKQTEFVASVKAFKACRREEKAKK
jgi:hypothetical protein